MAWIYVGSSRGPETTLLYVQDSMHGRELLLPEGVPEVHCHVQYPVPEYGS